MKKLKLHPSVTLDRVIASVERRASSLDNPGICVACGDDVEGVEPDARGYECEHCGGNAVYGDEELLMMLA